MHTIVVDGDVIARGEADDTSNVMVRVELDGQIAFGVARVNGPANAQAPEVRLARTRA